MTGNNNNAEAIAQINSQLNTMNNQNAGISQQIQDALGNINNSNVVPVLQGMLNDEEPNVRWDAAIALAKLEDRSGIDIIVNLLDRAYFANFKEVDDEEMVQAILVAIQISSKLPSDKFIDKLKKLAVFDKNMKIRDLAIKTLDKTYNRKI